MELCSDAVIGKDNPTFWNVNWETSEGGLISDYQGNFLRATTRGSICSW